MLNTFVPWELRYSYGMGGMTTYPGNATWRKVVRHCCQGLSHPCELIHSASPRTMWDLSLILKDAYAIEKIPIAYPSQWLTRHC